MQCSQYLQDMWTDIYSVATVRLRYDTGTITTRLTLLQYQVPRHHDVTLLTEYSVTCDKIRRDHTIEDIICYSYLLVFYCIGFYLPSDHLSGLGSHYNCPTLRYKRPRQTSILDGFSQPQLEKSYANV
jgi:hypothetical protein